MAVQYFADFFTLCCTLQQGIVKLVVSDFNILIINALALHGHYRLCGVFVQRLYVNGDGFTGAGRKIVH
ncbi:Uncharacterised protein [Vibrio cholerae]|nr:Uncharacterised protein [Vibrio cholerae]CSC79601.1 Uncharacterised protein [Vibrio cholerae]CSD70994.1 Uncharacterised protein [Vibrio cholerae]